MRLPNMWAILLRRPEPFLAIPALRTLSAPGIAATSNEDPTSRGCTAVASTLLSVCIATWAPSSGMQQFSYWAVLEGDELPSAAGGIIRVVKEEIEAGIAQGQVQP